MWGSVGVPSSSSGQVHWSPGDVGVLLGPTVEPCPASIPGSRSPSVPPFYPLATEGAASHELS